MKDLQWYLGEKYIDSYQPDIMNKAMVTLPDTQIPTIIPHKVVERPKTEVDMTYLKKKNIDEAIHQKLRKKDVYENDMHKVYNIIVVHMNDQLQEKAESDNTFQAVNSG